MTLEFPTYNFDFHKLNYVVFLDFSKAFHWIQITVNQVFIFDLFQLNNAILQR